MAKCEICSKKLSNTFLNKIVGTIIKDDKGKKHQVCAECQQKLGNQKDEMLKQMKS
ncbi:MAG: hypothetical protein ACOCWQ_05335 [Nanoarchaeota archaeon]